MTAQAPTRPLYRPIQWCPDCHAPVPVQLDECPECGEPMPLAAQVIPATTPEVCPGCKREGCDGSREHCPDRWR